MAEEDRLRRRVERARESKNNEDIENSLSALAGYLSDHCKYEEALHVYNEIMELFESKKDLLGVAKARRMMGEMLLGLAQYEESLQHINHYVDYAVCTKDKVEEQRAYATLGRMYFCWASNLTDKAETNEKLKLCQKAYKKSLQVCETELKNISHKERLEMTAKLLYNLGLAKDMEGNCKSAQIYISKAVEICESEKLYEDAVRCYSAQGDLYIREEKLPAAINSFDKALSITKYLHNEKESTVDILLHKSKACFMMRNYPGAKKILMAAYKLNSPNKDDHSTVIKQLKRAYTLCQLEEQLKKVPFEECLKRKKLYEKLGDLCCQVQNYKHGIECYKNMLDCAERLGESGKQLSPCFSSLIQTYKDDKQYDLALVYCYKDEELNHDNPKDLILTYECIAEILDLKGEDYIKVTETYYKAAELAKQLGDVKKTINILGSIEAIFRSNSRFELAEETRKSIEHLKGEINWVSDEEEESEEESQDLDVDINEILGDFENEKDASDRPSRNSRKKAIVKKNEKGESQLQVAVIKGNLNRVQTLIDLGHPVNTHDNNGWTPIHEAVNYAYLDILKLLVQHGADINSPGPENVTPLHDAASNGHFEVIDYLLEKGANTLELTSCGDTPLDCLRSWKRSNIKDMTEDEKEICAKLEERLECELDRVPREKRALKKVSSAFVVEDSDVDKKRPRPFGIKDRLQKSKTTDHPGPSSLRRGVDKYPEDSSGRWVDASPEKLSASDSGSDSEPEELSDKKSARHEYKTAMESLRKRAVPAPTEAAKKIIEPLIRAEDFVDDWLEDDLGVYQNPQKRRKTTDLIEHTHMRKKSTSETVWTLPTDEPEVPDQVIDEPELDGGSRMPDVEESNEPGNKPKVQTTLTRAGFERTLSRGSGPESEPEPELETEPEPAAQPEVVSPSQATPTDPPIQKIRLQLEDELLLLPIPVNEIPDKQVKWLIDDASKRYAKKTGRVPEIMTLTTNDGAVIDQQDPLALVVNEELRGTIERWRLISVIDRYEEACALAVKGKITNKEIDTENNAFDSITDGKPDSHLIRCLEKFAGTGCLILKKLALLPSQVEPLFKALEHEPSLEILDLSSNVLGDEGLDMLTRCLSKRPIKILNLGCNNISSSGVNKFVECLMEMDKPVLDNLKLIDFSFNPLDDECYDSIQKLTANLSNLKLLTKFCDFKKPMM